MSTYGPEYFYPRCSARLLGLARETTVADIKELFTSKGIPVSPSLARISLARDLDVGSLGTKIATVSFKDGDTLTKAMTFCEIGQWELHGRKLRFDTTFEGFTPLSDGEEADVIAVHGLNGHAFDTWRYHEGDEYSMWLRDSLPQRFPGARIMTFGYNFVDSICALPNPLWKLAKQLLEALCFLRSLNHRKPLVILAHSMGGLVVKQALILGNTSAFAHHKDVLECIRAITFFGTPHRGGICPGGVLALGLNAVDLSDGFVDVIKRHGIAICTMHEGKGTFGPFRVVSERSATLGVEGERKIRINSNHTNLCKFKGPTDPDYQTVCQALSELIIEFRYSTFKSFGLYSLPYGYSGSVKTE